MLANKGLGLTAHLIDHFKLVLKFPEGTNSTWYRNMTTVLTREYLDARPDGWFDYAAKRIAQLVNTVEIIQKGSFFEERQSCGLLTQGYVNRSYDSLNKTFYDDAELNYSTGSPMQNFWLRHCIPRNIDLEYPGISFWLRH